jgi:hypothetical protein
VNVAVPVGTVEGDQLAAVFQSAGAGPLPTQLASWPCAAPAARQTPASSIAARAGRVGDARPLAPAHRTPAGLLAPDRICLDLIFSR